MWEKQYGKETMLSILKGFESERGVFIRCNTLKISPEELCKKLNAAGVKAVISDLVPFAIRIENYDNIRDLPGFDDGEFYVQDLTSMISGIKADFKPGMKVIDMCSAPGGKTVNAALIMSNQGEIISRDVSETKVERIRENLERLGITCVKCEVHDGTVKDEHLIESADVVIADVPCSGLGVIGRKRDISHKMSIDKIDELVKLQRSIAEVASGYVKKGGTLIYSTCTVNKHENEENAKWLADNSDLKLVSCTQMLPGENDCDGFFVAKFIR